jgi:hypothetical protein
MRFATLDRAIPVGVLLVALLAGAGAVCGGCRATRDSDVSMTRIRSLGGHTAVVRANGRTVLVTSEGLTELRDGKPGRIEPLPEGYTLLGTVEPVDGGVVLVAERELAFWNLDPEADPAPIAFEDDFLNAFGADLVGGPAQELIVVTSRQFEDTGTPVGHDERLEVWSLEGERPERLWRSASQGDGVTSLVVAPRVAAHAGRAVLVWNQIHGRAWVENLATDTRMADPESGFAVSEAPAELRRDPSEVDQWSWGGPRLYPPPALASSELTTTWEVDEDFRRHVYVVNTRTGARQEIDGGTHGVGLYALADLDGDGLEDIAVGGSGEPGICSDTCTGYIGWSIQSGDGTFGPVGWTEGLDGGLATMRVEDIDGRPGAEIVATSVDSYCSGDPTGVYIVRF